jgi:hypothetical protein
LFSQPEAGGRRKDGGDTGHERKGGGYFAHGSVRRMVVPAGLVESSVMSP